MLVDVVLAGAGAAIVAATLVSAIGTVVIPHGLSTRLARFVFAAARRAAGGYGMIDRSARRQHVVLQVALAGGLLALPMIWLTSAVAGYTALFRAFGTGTWRESYRLAGSSMLTLGFADAGDLPRTTLAFSASALSMAILALLLVTYLPTIYQAYTERETRLTAFETLAGDPPNVVAMIVRSHRLNDLRRLSIVWQGWRQWFADVRESHTALPAVAFLGSSREDRSWVGTVGTVLDAAAVALAVLDVEDDPDAALCIRAGSLALRDIAAYFGVDVDEDPAPDDPVSVPRAVWDAFYDDLVEQGVPVVEREEAWRHWSGWRVNYDAALVALAELTASPTSRLSVDVSYGSGVATSTLGERPDAGTAERLDALRAERREVSADDPLDDPGRDRDGRA